MNYIELINNFWLVSESEDLSPHDQSTYFAILKYCNSLTWLNPFVCHWEILIQYSKTSKNSFYKSCETLDRIGLIKWEKGQRNSTKKPKIFVLVFKNKEGTNREQRRNKEGTTEEHGGNLYKQVNKETIKLINNNAALVNSHLKDWIESHSDKPELNKDIPTREDFISYALEKDSTVDKKALSLKYDSWVENNWKDGNDKKIKKWKSKLLNTLQYLPKTNGGSNFKSNDKYPIHLKTKSFDELPDGL